MFIYCGGKEETSLIVLGRIHMNTSWYHYYFLGHKIVWNKLEFKKMKIKQNGEEIRGKRCMPLTESLSLHEVYRTPCAAEL